ncbi:Cytochrome P450 CYP73A100 [Cinnamomum micranthum f. kanehirae]|uniref:Cytochrome P450 CYP73A100 n=1 Tax=Cinnamomum micranthum f. kanehirae TaxID=337451 RepID=A0A443PYT5_9MAGN|nr:Cytochrome P450 CYP73A100 [Cinnamomum micranthum f. kanehirae]
MGTILTKPVTFSFFLLIGLLALTKLLNPTLYSSITTPSNLVLPLTLSLIALSLILPLFKKSNLPPGPPSLPIFGNWLQVGSDLNHRFLASLSQ